MCKPPNGTRQEGYLNIYRDNDGDISCSASLYTTEKEARENADYSGDFTNYVATIPVSWEE